MAPHEDMRAAAGLVAPGTALRDALDAIVAGGTGALVVVGDEAAVDALGDGGFRIDSPFTRQALCELCKMDGAVTLDGAVATIRRANVHLEPDRALPTAETGIRHRTAERLARATAALVIAVSERGGTITLYRGSARLVVRASR